MQLECPEDCELTPLICIHGNPWGDAGCCTGDGESGTWSGGLETCCIISGGQWAALYHILLLYACILPIPILLPRDGSELAGPSDAKYIGSSYVVTQAAPGPRPRIIKRNCLTEALEYSYV